MSRGIYLIENQLDGKVYVGSSINVEQRMEKHHRMLQGGYHFSAHLQAAWNLYGKDIFTFRSVEWVFYVDRLLERETAWIEKLHATDPLCGYNLSPVAGSRLGVRSTEETKRKISESLLGHVVTAETCAKLSASNTGKHHTDEAKAKMSAAKKGKSGPGLYLTDDGRRRLSEYHTGKQVSLETRRRLSESHKGLRQSEEAKRKKSEAMLGRKKSKETRKRMVIAQRARFNNPSRS